ncbi:hypothetical protein BD311DRAFT_297775 [Dichomitus squalens]|uniref:Uncharacterized protein n=1 Tax=Dichomitus squalens TaxID=114155 RepID=A0A4Q9MRJ5_9APHY|nr:hypothetical protein BD311DRAFT_297775 [Dichomitus squalens]
MFFAQLPSYSSHSVFSLALVLEREAPFWHARRLCPRQSLWHSRWTECSRATRYKAMRTLVATATSVPTAPVYSTRSHRSCSSLHSPQTLLPQST